MSPFIHFLIFIIGLIVGVVLVKFHVIEGFSAEGPCASCGAPSPCGCPIPQPSRKDHGSKDSSNGPADKAECKQPNMSKYVLKSSIPPCPAVPDLSNYILKSECPPVPDLSNYVLKSSIPKQNPVILDCSKCQKPKGECPPCPRPRCPDVVCPPAQKCPSCAPCPRQKCPPATIKCKAEHGTSGEDDLVRPYLAPLNFRGFGMD